MRTADGSSAQQAPEVRELGDIEPVTRVPGHDIDSASDIAIDLRHEVGQAAVADAVIELHGRAEPQTDRSAVIHVFPGHEGGKLAAARPWQLIAKRIVDIVGASLAMLVLSPILFVTALAVRLTSPGPIIHRQIRIGQDGEPFVFLKFRSMYVDAEHLKKSLSEFNEAQGPIFKIKHDPRITPVGRLMRRLSIDELPQLFHVLAGQMSLVGPRPHLPEEVAVYDGEARRRLAVRPGVTGIWQVSGRSDLDFDTWIAMDLEYLDHWSLRMDLKLMLKTFSAVLSGRGAY